MRQFQSIVPLLMVIVVGVLTVLAGPRLLRQYTLAEQSARIVLARDVLESDDILRRIDRAIAAIADSVSPSIVHLDTAGDRRFVTGSSGAGWVYDQRGHVVTNAHVVRDSRRIMVEFADGVVAGGTLVGSDVYTDIAVIRVDRPGSELFPAVRSVTRLPRMGERVFAFGSPFGFKFSMSEGIVSGLGRQAPGSSIPGGYTNYIQTDAAVNPGNSGGPLVNTDAQVIGMNVAIATSRSAGASPDEAGGDSAGISFAIPLGTIEPIVDQLIRFGEVSRGYMGISFGGASIDRVTTDDGRVLTGIRVAGVEDDGPSDRAGIERGDVIVSVRGSPVLNTESLSSLVSSGRPGDEVGVRVWRDGELMDKTVVLAPIRNEVLAQRLSNPTQLRLGAIFAPAPDRSGIEVRDVWEGMPASASGLRVGDRITHVDGKPVENLDDFYVIAADAGLLTGLRVRMNVVDPDGTAREIRVSVSP